VRGLEREFFDHIYLDLNGLVHVLGRRAKDEDHLITMLFRQLDRLLKICVPTRTVFIALDGPASAAKLITQRKRRLESVRKQQRKMDREKEEETGNGASTGVAAASSSGGASALGSGSVYDGGQGSQIGNTTMAGEEGVFDFSRLVSVIYGEEHLAQYKQQQAQQQQPQQGQATPQPNEFSSNGGAATGAKQQKKKKKRPAGEFNLLQVTAGCPFMHRLKQSICYWACTRLQSDRKYSNVRIFVSGADVSGEGEVKIMEHIVGHANQSGRTTGSGGIGNGDEIWGVSEIAEFREQSHLIVGSDADLILLGKIIFLFL
jgi:5'-3' exonuclease